MRGLLEGFKVCIKCAAALNGFGPGASPPMQPVLGHSALKLCAMIGELRLHVGRSDVRNDPLRILLALYLSNRTQSFYGL